MRILLTSPATGRHYPGRLVLPGLLLGLLLWFCMTTDARAERFAGQEIPDNLIHGDTTLVLNGTGLRTRLIAKLYIASLYLLEPSSDATTIVAADEPMAIRLQIISGLINTERLIGALRDGFTRSTNGDTEPIKADMDALFKLSDRKINKQDVFVFRWQPGDGLYVSRNNEISEAFGSLAFKQALFGIWLSDPPSQRSLKNAMLGLD